MYRLAAEHDTAKPRSFQEDPFLVFRHLLLRVGGAETTERAKQEFERPLPDQSDELSTRRDEYTLLACNKTLLPSQELKVDEQHTHFPQTTQTVREVTKHYPESLHLRPAHNASSHSFVGTASPKSNCAKIVYQHDGIAANAQSFSYP
jgi:hypothetical protein